jgi:hypothetical protein
MTLKLKILVQDEPAQFLLGTIRFVIGAMLLWGSLTKIGRPFEFLNTIYHYQMSGPKLSLMVAICIPWLELTAAICLLGGIFLDGALVITCLLGAIFSVAVGSALLRGLKISCGCFTSANDLQIGYRTLVRSLSILLAGLVGLWLLRRTTPEPTALLNTGSPTPSPAPT